MTTNDHSHHFFWRDSYILPNQYEFLQDCEDNKKSQEKTNLFFVVVGNAKQHLLCKNEEPMIRSCVVTVEDKNFKKIKNLLNRQHSTLKKEKKKKKKKKG